MPEKPMSVATWSGGVLDEWMSVVSVVYCQAEVSVVCQSLFQRSTIVCCVSKVGIT